MVVGKIAQGPSTDSDLERARLARLQLRQEEDAAAEKARKEKESQDAERLAAEARAAEEKKKEEERIAEEKKKEEARIAEEKRQEEARVAEEKRKEQERVAEEKRKEEQRVADEKRKEQERIEEEKRKEEKRQEEERLAEVRRIAEKKRREEEAAAEKARRLEEEQRKLAEAKADFEKINELPDPPILFDSFGDMGLRCISHREERVVKPGPEGVKIVIGCISLENTRMLVKLEKEDKTVVGEHAVMCTMSYSKALGAHFVAEAIIPAAGNYALKFFCNVEAGKSGYSHVATYDIEADAPSTRSAQRFPKLHPAVAMALIEPLTDAVTIGQEVSFKVVLGPGVTASQVATADGKRHMLKESSEGELRVASGTVKIVGGSQNEGATSIICQKDGGEEWLVFTKFVTA